MRYERAFSSGRHDCRLSLRVFIGALVERRILLYGLTLGAFVLTLAFSSWHDGLWRSPAAPVAGAAPQPHKDSLVPTGARPTAGAAPAAAAMNPAPAIAPPEPVQSEAQNELSSTPDVEDGAMRARRDRGAGRGARSH